MKRNDLATRASALAGLLAAVCCSFVWLSGGIAILVLPGTIA